MTKKKKKENICLMTNHQNNEVTSQFSYHDLFRIYNKLTKETNKLEQIILASKDTILCLKLKNKTLERNIKLLREKQNVLVQSPFTSREDGEPVKCDRCDNLKNEIFYFQKNIC